VYQRREAARRSLERRAGRPSGDRRRQGGGGGPVGRRNAPPPGGSGRSRGWRGRRWAAAVRQTAAARDPRAKD
jgi:hypothetical protein